MIPRYAPTYTYNDLFHGLKNIPQKVNEEEITSHISRLCKVKHVFLLNNARAGLYTILKAYDRTGRVLIPAYNCISVPEAAHYAGYQPEFVDINLGNLNVIPELFAKSITHDTTAVIPTHLFGIPCNIDEVLPIFKQRDILVIEDAAPALGAEYKGTTVGSFGDASVISFGGRKVIYGEAGGAILTNNEELAIKIKVFLSHINENRNKWIMSIKAGIFKTALNPIFYGTIRRVYALLFKELMYEIFPARLEQPKGYLANMPGYSCALVKQQLDRLSWNLRQRRNIARIYRDQLENHSGWILPEIPNSAYPSWIQFPIICEDKLAFYNHMKAEGVDVSWTYKYSCAESFGFNDYPNAQQAAKKVVSLPTTPFIDDQQTYKICSKALKFSNGRQK
jgi:perosamine synthetase